MSPSGLGVSSFEELYASLIGYLSPDLCAQIENAYLLAEKAHEGQKRRSGEPYITHPLEVAFILAELRLDAPSIMAALLHDTLEDTSLSKEDIAQHFGSDVANLVDGVTKLTNISADNFRKMIVAMARDVRVILIKLADRLHNMRTLAVFPLAKQQRIAHETIELYAPLAARLGIQSMREELEDRSFLTLYPWRYAVLSQALQRIRRNRSELLASLEASLALALEKRGIGTLMIRGREKHAYSVYRKMRNKRLSFHEVMDVYGFRVVVDSVDTCYRALGVAHSVFKPVMGRFKDYIALPKANHYQSLHTTLLGPHGVPLELQIRTEAMDHHAENGVAAHWLYKTSGYTHTWGENILAIEHQLGDTSEFVETVKYDLTAESVYVFTPKGKLLTLPEGSTCVDVAYAIHTDIGHHCVAAKIDRRLAPLSLRVHSGQTIDILVMPQGCPDPHWLSFVVTAKAKTQIRSWLKNKQKGEARLLGEALLEHSDLTQLCQEHGAIEKEVLFEDYGLGRRLLKKNDLDTPLILSGEETYVVHYPSCCYPIPGDRVEGLMVRDEGLVVHRIECAHYDRGQALPLQWAESSLRMYVAEIVVDVVNKRGVLAHMAGAIAEGQADIDNVVVDERDERHYSVRFILKVRDRDHLARVMRRLRSIVHVTRILRVMHD